MLAVDCPSCNESLEVADQYRGKKVRCPHCKAVLQVPAAEPPPSPAPPEPEPARSAFDFSEEDDRPRRRKRDEEEEETPRRRKRQAEGQEEGEQDPLDFDDRPSTSPGGARKAGAAVSWLNYTVIFGGVHAVACCLFQGYQAVGGRPEVLVLALVVMLFRFVPLVFIGLGANSLQRWGSYGLAMTGAVFSILYALGCLVGLGSSLLAFLAMDRWAVTLERGVVTLNSEDGMLLLYAVGTAASSGLLLGLSGMAAFKTLAALNDPKVQALFKKRSR